MERSETVEIVRPGAPPEGIRLRGRVGETTVRRAAALVADDLLQAADGPASLPTTWLRLAERRGIDLAPHNITGEVRGAYIPDGPAGRPVILYDQSLPTDVLCRVLIHELAHDVLEGWEPPRLPGLADAERFDDQRRGVAHRIARAVEALVAG